MNLKQWGILLFALISLLIFGLVFLLPNQSLAPSLQKEASAPVEPVLPEGAALPAPPRSPPRSPPGMPAFPVPSAFPLGSFTSIASQVAAPVLPIKPNLQAATSTAASLALSAEERQRWIKEARASERLPSNKGGLGQLGSISGRVLDNLSGNLDFSSEGNRPLVGVPLLLLDQDNETVAQTRTDSQGRFAFSNLVANTYRVTCRDLPGTRSLADTDGADPNQTKVVLRRGVFQGGVDFLDYYPGEVGGRILTPAGVGVPGVPVHISYRGSILETVTANARGEYGFSNLIPDVYQIEADHEEIPSPQKQIRVSSGDRNLLLFFRLSPQPSSPPF